VNTKNSKTIEKHGEVIEEPLYGKVGVSMTVDSPYRSACIPQITGLFCFFSASRFFVFSFFIIVLFGSVRQIKLATRQLLDALIYSIVSCRIVPQSRPSLNDERIGDTEKQITARVSGVSTELSVGPFSLTQPNPPQKKNFTHDPTHPTTNTTNNEIFRHNYDNFLH